VLVVPSMINRWYVVDLRPGASLIEGLAAAGLDVFVLDWGVPKDEDRHLSWDDVLRRLARFERRARRIAGVDRLGLVGYCMGATLCAIHTALNPSGVGAFCNLLGPIDFADAGFLGRMVDARWFDPAALTLTGNLASEQMQAGFVSMRPTMEIGKWVGAAARWEDPNARKSFVALQTWAQDNIPFPAAAYVTYIRELYQQNRLAQGQHHALGQRVDLGEITCPVFTVTTDRDTICPPAAATALNRLVSSPDTTVHATRGGHVGAVVGRRARAQLYPAMGEWFLDSRAT